MAILGSLACAVHAAPAAAANKVVKMGDDNKLIPAAVTISPGDTVTWDWIGPDTDHSPEAFYGQGEYWDADPGEDGEYDHKLGPNFSHKFTYSGVFRYRCTVHPDQMTGTITVKGPAAALKVATPAPVTGRAVTFDGRETQPDAGTKIVAYRWDLDGDPTTGADGFERDTGTTATATTTYQTTGTRTVRLMAVDAKGHRSVAVQRIGVDSPVPVPGFMASPYAPVRGESVTFDGRFTTDADGDVATYEWDLDGDAATGADGFETNTGASATASHVYSRGGSIDVRLRVTDAAGHSAIASRRITISDAPPTTAPPGGSDTGRTPPTPGGNPPTDGPGLAATAARVQRVLRARRLLVSAKCARTCTVVARGSVRVGRVRRALPLGRAKRRLQSGRRVTLSIALPRATATALRRALRQRRKATAVVIVAAPGAPPRTLRVALRA